MQEHPFGLIEIDFLSGMESYFLRFSRVIECPVVLSSRECFASWRDKFLFRVGVYSAVSQVKMSSYASCCPVQFVSWQSLNVTSGQFKSPYISFRIHHISTSMKRQKWPSAR